MKVCKVEKDKMGYEVCYIIKNQGQTVALVEITKCKNKFIKIKNNE